MKVKSSYFCSHGVHANLVYTVKYITMSSSHVIPCFALKLKSRDIILLSHDDATLDKISKEMMASSKKIKGDYGGKPAWLSISKGLMPDYIVTDPKQSAVWEISGIVVT